MIHRGPFQPLPFCDSVIPKANYEQFQSLLVLNRQLSHLKAGTAYIQNQTTLLLVNSGEWKKLVMKLTKENIIYLSYYLMLWLQVHMSPPLFLVPEYIPPGTTQ